MQGHRGPVSGLSIDHDEKGFFSASWDGEAIVRFTLGSATISCQPIILLIAMGLEHGTSCPKVYLARGTTCRCRSKTTEHTVPAIQLNILGWSRRRIGGIS